MNAYPVQRGGRNVPAGSAVPKSGTVRICRLLSCTA